MIDITGMLIAGIITSIIGFITTWFFGFNIPKILSDATVILVLTLPIMLYNPNSTIEQMTNWIVNYMNTFVGIIIPAVIGDAIGTTISEVLSPSSRRQGYYSRY